jgi:hypothetical protein
MKFKRGDRIKATEFALSRFIVKKEKRGIFLHYVKGYPVVLWDDLRTPNLYHRDFIESED